MQLHHDILDVVKDSEQKILELTGRDSLVKIEKNVIVIAIHTRTKCGLEVVNLIPTDGKILGR